MAGEEQPTGGFRISPVDRRGRPISPPVLSAAEEVVRRAIHHAERLRLDAAVAATLLEEAAATVSRAVQRKIESNSSVADLHRYLFRAFLHRLNKASRRRRLVESALRLEAVITQRPADPRILLERKILIDQFLTECDPTIRDLFYCRIQGLTWNQIGWTYGISGHDAESRFSQAVQRMRRRLGLSP